ncbi:MAG TPA: GTP-binding protein [Solirubrobacteraceae bacterium]|nr:GTP-binding protein [Solirubrobacteraceae bacterium]
MNGTRARADGRELGRRLRDRDLTASAAALNLIESRAPDAREQAETLLAALSPAALGYEAPGHIVGLTGPPGVGKSSLLSQLVKHWRSCDRSVAILAIDPSSKRSGGSLLGDRARIETDPKDRHVFIRSTAAGTRLGGLAPATRAASEVLAAAFDMVVIETVGVGQSETEIADAADTVAVVLQPSSGDVLQFLKAGIMEVPDVLVLTKTDLGAAATRAMSDLQAALLALGATETELCPVSSVPPPQGIERLAEALEAHRQRIDLAERRRNARRRHALENFAVEHGDRGLRALGGRLQAERWLETQDPALDVPALERALTDRAESEDRR